MMDKQMRRGLETIRDVLDYATDSSATRQNRIVWVKNAVDDLLAGRKVREPKRGFGGEHYSTDPIPPLRSGYETANIG